MFALRLVQLIETHANQLSEGLLHELKSSDRCNGLLRNVPGDELKRRTCEIYRNLSDWLLSKTESEIEERYTGLGARRAKQGVPFSDFLWAVSATKDYLWNYMRNEGVFEEPVELFGEMELLHLLERFFDRAAYFAAIGYERERDTERTRASTSHAGRHESGASG